MNWALQKLRNVRFAPVQAEDPDEMTCAPSQAMRASAAAAALRRTIGDLEAQEASVSQQQHTCLAQAAKLRDAHDEAGGVFHLQRAAQHGARLALLRRHMLGVEQALHQLQACASVRAVCDELDQCSRALQAVAPNSDAIDDLLEQMDVGHEAPEAFGACANEIVDARDWGEELRLLPPSSTNARGGSGAAAATAVAAWPRAPTRAPSPALGAPAEAMDLTTSTNVLAQLEHNASCRTRTTKPSMQQ